jgi:hypothetical protein
MFAIYGAPLTLIADNMSFSSQLMREFARNWSFDIVTSSPEYPRSNGQAERCIQTVKLLLKKTEGVGRILTSRCSITVPLCSPARTRALLSCF